jgi:hypothetical protein
MAVVAVAQPWRTTFGAGVMPPTFSFSVGNLQRAIYFTLTRDPHFCSPAGAKSITESLAAIPQSVDRRDDEQAVVYLWGCAG